MITYWISFPHTTHLCDTSPFNPHLSWLLHRQRSNHAIAPVQVWGSPEEWENQCPDLAKGDAETKSKVSNMNTSTITNSSWDFVVGFWDRTLAIGVFYGLMTHYELLISMKNNTNSKQVQFPVYWTNSCDGVVCDVLIHTPSWLF